GAFARQDLEIRLHFTTNSMQQLSGLVRGEWEIGLTGFDNVVAYQEGQGEAEIDREPDLFVFMGGDDAFLRLVVQPDIGSYAAFIRGYLAALDWLYDRRNEDAACSLLVEKVPNMWAELAKASYRILVAEHGGFEPKACLDPQGVATVLALRSEYGRPQKLLADTRKYDDMSYYRRAI